jgi:hypothetical protein
VHASMENRSTSRRWSTGLLAFWGALFGVLLVVAHEAYDISSSHFHAADPFAHIMSEVAGAALGGALVFAVIAVIHNWVVRQGRP